MKKLVLVVLLNFVSLLSWNASVEATFFNTPICNLGAERLYTNIMNNAIRNNYVCSPFIRTSDFYGGFTATKYTAPIYVVFDVNNDGYVTEIYLQGSGLSKQSLNELLDFGSVCLQSIGVSNTEMVYLAKNIRESTYYDERRGKVKVLSTSVYVSSTGYSLMYTKYMFESGERDLFITNVSG